MDAIFKRLRGIMAEHVGHLDIVHDRDDYYYVDTHHIQKNKKPLYFGGVKLQKKYVSYYLMPVYGNPELTEGISAELTNRRQGKSCFNFKAEDEALFAEIAELTKQSVEDFKSQGFIE